MAKVRGITTSRVQRHIANTQGAPARGPREPLGTQRPAQREVKRTTRSTGVQPKTGGYIINETTGQRYRNTK